MKKILLTLVAASLTTSAFAGTSDRYNDQRFNSAVGHVADMAAKADMDRTGPTVVFASRSDKTKGGVRYPDTNPLGVGPYNDSR